MSKKIQYIYAADTETATEGKPDAFLLGITDIFNNASFWSCDNPRSFIEHLSTLPNNAIVYFHNLKFDYSYLFPFLFGKYKLEELIVGIQRKIFKVTISMGNKKIELRDSCPLFAPSYIALAKVAKGWCKEYDEKGQVSHYKKRPEKVSQKYFDYFKRDVFILAEALRERFKLCEGKIKLTSSGEAKDRVKETMNKEHPKERDYFDNVAFPALTMMEDTYLRPFYNGGYVWLNPLHAEEIVKDVEVYDVNSMYPSVMLQERLPYGNPMFFKGAPPKGKLYCVRFFVAWAQLKKGCPPFITNSSRSIFGSKSYLYGVGPQDTVEDRTFSLTNMELEMFLACYEHGEIVYFDGYAFKSNDDNFEGYIYQYTAMKQNNKGAKREYAKLALNAPSGKWAQNPSVQTYHSELDKNGKQVFRENELEENKPFYVPVSIFITAYARMRIVKAIIEVGLENVIYTDTDSLHLLHGCGKNLPTHPTRFGYWDFEKQASEGKYLRVKRYCLRIGGELRFTIAGIPQRFAERAIHSLEDFKAGEFVPCERMKMEPGGMQMKWLDIKI